MQQVVLPENVFWNVDYLPWNEGRCEHSIDEILFGIKLIHQ